MRRLPIAFALVALVLAGCAQEEAPAAVAEPTVILVTEQDDVASLANDSFMMAAHQHDYWGGKERIVVLDQDMEQTGCCLTLGTGGLELVFFPEAGDVVPHGAARVEVTVSWTGTTMTHVSAPELWVQTAADHEPIVVGAITSGAPLVIETTDAQLDLPHQSLSAWRFTVHFEPGPSGAYTRWEGDLHLFAEAVRGRDIPVYPPHPDLWQGRDAIPLFEEAVDPALWQGVIDESERGYSCIRGCWPRLHRAENGTVVPFDAALVEVILDARPDPGFDMGLKFHGADAREFTDLEPVRVEGTQRFYEIPVELGMGDSPYAAQSVWGFAVYSAQPERDGWFSGSYTMSARVLRATS